MAACWPTAEEQKDHRDWVLSEQGSKVAKRRGEGAGPYLRILQARQVRVQVEFDPFCRTWERHSTDQENDEHDERERRCDVHNLGGIFVTSKPLFTECSTYKTED